MKYHYFYQTKENQSRDGWIDARDRGDAYTQLRKQGIKPYKLLGKNPIAWKRWAAIAVLGLIAVFLAVQIALESRPIVEEPRSQLYGDPASIQRLSANGWCDTFADAGDAWFACHAIPASACNCSNSTRPTCSTRLIDISPDDTPELAKMKRMINSMKRELSEYLAGGGSAEDYMLLCDERLATERGLVDSYKKDFDRLEKKGGNIEDAWEKKNAELRSMGLPTVLMPIDAE